MDYLNERKRILNDIKNAGKTQVELAAKASIAQPHISAYLSGKRSMEIDTFIRIADAAGLRITFEKK